MEDLQKQESELEDQLQQTQGQLAAVGQQLLVDLSEHDRSDFLKLKDDLVQLVDLTREGLLEIKKQRLLLALQPPCLTLDNNTSAPNDIAESRQLLPPATTSSCAAAGTVAMGDEEDDPLHGMKCCAPIAESWGAVNYHNAMVMCREAVDGDTEDDFSVRVLFTTPTYNAMKPCSFFLEGRCRFGDMECKFSHGHVVRLSQLLPYQEPNFSLASIGGRCRAQHTDGLWYEGIISSIGESLESITVHFNTLNATVSLDSSSVIPLGLSDEGSSDGERDEGDEEEGEEEEEVIRVLEWKPTGLQRPLGEWEKHTTGIGSKLMAKMGYEIGKGLGRDSCGRVEPVDIVILPSGKSLDVCAKMREDKKLKNALGEKIGKKRRKPAKSITTEEQPNKESVDLFEFLNKKILKKDPLGSSVDPSMERRSSGQPVGASGDLNLKLFRTHEEMKTVQRNLQKLKESLARQKGDKSTEAHYKEKIAGVERQLQDLQRQEQSLQDGMKSKTERRKLSIF